MIVEIQFKDEGDKYPLMQLSVFGTIVAIVEELGIDPQQPMEVDYGNVSSLSASCAVYLGEYSSFLFSARDSDIDINPLVQDLVKLNNFPEWLEDVFYMTRTQSIEDYEEVCSELLQLVDSVCTTHKLSYVIIEG